ncbi:MAG: DUF433 domain-containing protein [Planctomycetes bacterium]|nr:DUF433 domain-containing protein [Planctomycetota bacterium]
MTDKTLLERITADPAIFDGKPIVRGMRISVELILSLLAQVLQSSSSSRKALTTASCGYPMFLPLGASNSWRRCLNGMAWTSPQARSLPFGARESESQRRDGMCEMAGVRADRWIFWRMPRRTTAQQAECAL